MEESIINGYVQDADFLIEAYEAISSVNVLSYVSEFIPPNASNIIDIGAGTGRDAAWLASKGHDVLAVEPVGEFRQAGANIHSSSNITWLNDSLPCLSQVISNGQLYDLALLVAVWHHIPNEEKLASLNNARRVLNENGVLILSVRNGPGTLSRTCYSFSAKQTIGLANRCNLTLIANQAAQSVQKHNQESNVSWHWLVFKAC